MFGFLEYNPLKRFYKYILKRVVGNFLQNELDLDQLEVQLGAGTVELRDLELNVDVSARQHAALIDADRRPPSPRFSTTCCKTSL
jgi:hypothetical protein